MPRNKKNKNRAAPAPQQPQQTSKGATAAGGAASAAQPPVPAVEKIDVAVAENKPIEAEALAIASAPKNVPAAVAADTKTGAIGTDTVPNAAEVPKTELAVVPPPPKKPTSDDEDGGASVGLSKSQKKKNKKQNKNKENKGNADVKASSAGEVTKAEEINVTEKVEEKVALAKTEGKPDESVKAVEVAIKPEQPLPEESKADEEFVGEGEFQTQHTKSKKKNKNKNKQDIQVVEVTKSAKPEGESKIDISETKKPLDAVKPSEIQTPLEKPIETVCEPNILDIKSPIVEDKKPIIDSEIKKEQILKSDGKDKPKESVVEKTPQSPVTQPENIAVTRSIDQKPACPVLSPDIASIWKILDPPTDAVVTTSTPLNLNLNILKTSSPSSTEAKPLQPTTPKVSDADVNEIPPVVAPVEVPKTAEKTSKIEKSESVKDKPEEVLKKSDDKIKESHDSAPVITTGSAKIEPLLVKAAAAAPEPLPKPVVIEEKPIAPIEKIKPTDATKETVNDEILLKAESKIIPSTSADPANIESKKQTKKIETSACPITNLPATESKQQTQVQPEQKSDPPTKPIEKLAPVDKASDKKIPKTDTAIIALDTASNKIQPKPTENKAITPKLAESEAITAITSAPILPESQTQTVIAEAVIDNKPSAKIAVKPPTVNPVAKPDVAVLESPTSTPATKESLETNALPAAKPEKPIKNKTAAAAAKEAKAAPKEPKSKSVDKAKDSTTAPTEKSAKAKATKTKTKAPAPPTASKDAVAASKPPSEPTVVTTESLSLQQLGMSTATTISTDSKNAAGSDSAQSVDVAAAHLISSTNPAESLHRADENAPPQHQDVSITADVILSKDVNATFTIAATKKAGADETKKSPPKECTTAKASSADEATALLELLQTKAANETVPHVKPGAVAGNVRTKPSATPQAKPATTPTTTAAPKTQNPTGTVPKQSAKQASPAKDVPSHGKPSAAAAAVPKVKQPSPPKETAASTPPSQQPSSFAPVANKKSPSARSAKTPPRNATTTAPAAQSGAAPAPAANKSRASPHKEKAAAAAKSAAGAPTTAAANKPAIQPRPNKTLTTAAGAEKTATRSASSASSSSSSSPNPPYDDEEYVEFKFSPRPVYMSTICQVCKVSLPRHVHCKQCLMVSYCSVEHLEEDAAGHRALCTAIQEIAKKRGGHVYNNARILNDDDYRSLRVHTLNLCENALQRHLQPFEREILLFPRLCATGTCREWRQQLLAECKCCGQVRERQSKFANTISMEFVFCAYAQLGIILCGARQPFAGRSCALVPGFCAVPEAGADAEEIRSH